MSRKLVSLAISLIVILNLGLCFGAESKVTPMISSDELIVAAPTTDILYSGKSAFINVNVITTINLQDHPVHVSLIQIEDKLPFADLLDEQINVPIIKLSSSALLKEKPEVIKTIVLSKPQDKTLATTPSTVSVTTKYSANFGEETKIINTYFSMVDRVNTLTAEITAINKKYKFGTLDVLDFTNASNDIQSAYKKWANSKEQLAELKKDFDQVQARYLQLYEVELFKDEIMKPSFLKDIGKLEVGKYKLRFRDSNQVIIREIIFEVVREEDTLKTVLPQININEKLGN